MDLLLSFPNELLSLIVQQLSAKDIDNLFSIPVCKQRLEGLIYVITDTKKAPIYHGNIPKRLFFDTLDPEMLKTALLVIIEFSQDWKKRFMDEILRKHDSLTRGSKMALISEIVPTLAFVYSNRVLGYSQTKRKWIVPKDVDRLTANFGKKLLNISMEDVKSVQFEQQVVRGYEFPGASELIVHQGNKTPDFSLFPNFKKLTVLGNGRFSALEKAATKDEVQRLHDQFYSDAMKLPYLEELTIKNKDKSFTSFRNLSFDNLRVLVLEECTQLKSFCSINLPNAVLLTICCSRHLSEIRDINAPKLLDFKLRVQPSLSLKSFHCPQLTNCTLHNDNEVEVHINPLDFDIAWLSTVKNLTYKGSDWDILLGDHKDQEEFDSSSLANIPLRTLVELPALRTLSVQMTLVGDTTPVLKRWPFVHSPALSKLEISIVLFWDKDFDGQENRIVIPDFAKFYPHLEEFTYKETKDIWFGKEVAPLSFVSRGATYKHLKSLKIYGASNVNLSNLKAPRLENFELVDPDIRYEYPSLPRFPSSLKSLKLEYTLIDTVDLTNCSELETLEMLDCEIHSLVIPDCHKLKSVDLGSDAQFGFKLVAPKCLPCLESLELYDKAIGSFDRVDLPLLTKERDYHGNTYYEYQ